MPEGNREKIDSLGWSLNSDGNVVLTMTPDDWAGVLMALGYAAGAASRLGSDNLPFLLGLLNRLNVGNPNYVPYEVTDDRAKATN